MQSQLRLCFDPSRPQRLADKSPFLATCSHVFDGDTIRVDRVTVSRGQLPVEIVRLAGIDAPEMRSADRARALASRQALADLLLLRQVTIQPTRIWRCPYGRIVANVLCESVLANAWMVQHGWAVPLKRHR